MQFFLPCYLPVTSGYLVVTSGYLVVTFGYFWFLVLVTTYFCLGFNGMFRIVCNGINCRRFNRN